MKIFINIIENEISNIINITFNNFIKNKKLENIIKKEKNVSKIIENINNISDLLIQKIDIKKIKEIINLKENIPKIILFIKTYLFYYILLFTSFYLKEENFIDLIIKIQNITSNKLLINNNDSKKIINLYNFLTQVKFILNNINTDKFNNELKYNIKYKLVIQFINKYVTNDNLKFYVGNSIENYHNIIFFILIQYNYVNDDIKYIYKLLDDNNNIIYKYINIVVPLLNIIDKNTLETVFNNNLQRPDFINDVYNILKYEKKIISEKEKLNIIMKQNIIFPIVEDVLRYNKVSDSFDKNNTKFDKSNTKIKYIVSNINEIQNYNIKNDEEKKKNR